MSRRTGTFVLLAALCLTASVRAHHNMSAAFDFNDRVSLTGTLTKVDWRNPHIYLFLDVKREGDQVEAWSIEGPSPSFFRARDISSDDFKAGGRQDRERRGQSCQGPLQVRSDPDRSRFRTAKKSRSVHRTVERAGQKRGRTETISAHLSDGHGCRSRARRASGAAPRGGPASPRSRRTSARYQGNPPDERSPAHPVRPLRQTHRPDRRTRHVQPARALARRQTGGGHQGRSRQGNQRRLGPRCRHGSGNSDHEHPATRGSQHTRLVSRWQPGRVRPVDRRVSRRCTGKRRPGPAPRSCCTGTTPRWISPTGRRTGAI